MWNKIKSIFSQFWNKLFFWRKEEIGKDPTKSWPYGHKLGAKVYYFPDKKLPQRYYSLIGDGNPEYKIIEQNDEVIWKKNQKV